MNKPIRQAEINRENYRAFPGLNYSFLADYRESEEKAAKGTGPKSFFETGKAFESIIEDRATGSTLFADRYFVANVTGTMPEKLSRGHVNF